MGAREEYFFDRDCEQPRAQTKSILSHSHYSAEMAAGLLLALSFLPCGGLRFESVHRALASVDWSNLPVARSPEEPRKETRWQSCVLTPRRIQAPIRVG